MAEHETLLVELGTEELPPKALLELERAFRDGLAAGLRGAGLNPGPIRSFATPRRLAVMIEELPLRQPDRTVERRGPPVKVAFDADGRPTRAALAFAESCGMPVEQIGRVETPKGAWLSHAATEAGQATAALLPAIVARAAADLPVPKRMRWGSGDAEFVRPVHWLVMLLGSTVVPGRVLELEAGRTTRGHRFHAPHPLDLARAQDYTAVLEERGRVIADFARRRARIEADVRAAAAAVGGDALIHASLLDEVTALTEWPVALAGHFEERFLELPAEVLVATLQDHQRYFPVRARGALAPYFVAVANLESRAPALVRAGNERVVRPRLADAAFFWDSDRSRSLASREEALAGVVYQARLGSLADKARRVAKLARLVATRLGGDAELAERAARLAKCDLLTQMVGEFPELQGVMGRYYALNDGEHAEVASALEEQYLPRFAGDRLPGSSAGRALAIADKLDTLAGSFAVGSRPTGNKDPFGLRRGALGALRIIIECGLELDLRELLAEAVHIQPVPGAVPDELYEFMMERLRAWYLDAGGEFDAGEFEAVLARRPTSPLDFDRRLRAVHRFLALDASASLAAANKRIANILRQAGDPELPAADTARFTEPAERALHAELTRQQARVEPLLAAGRYAEALEQLAELRGVVDEFFDRVLVMAEDAGVRMNRLALLAQLRRLFLHTADLSRVQPKS